MANLLLLILPVWSLATPDGFPPALHRKGCLPEDGQAKLFCPEVVLDDTETYGCYKIPTIMRTLDGTLLAMVEARKYSCDDQGYVDLRLRRSQDEGKTWEPSILVHGQPDETWTTVGDGTGVVDHTTGVIHLLHTHNNTRLFLSNSADEGLTWSEPVDVSETLKLGTTDTGWVGTGHAGGMQLSAGPKAGRLIIPTYSGSGSYAVYSDDQGATWSTGEPVTGVEFGKDSGAGEHQISETGTFAEDGTPILLMNRRNSPKMPNLIGITSRGRRLLSYSHDGGETWGEVWQAKELPEPIKGCEGSTIFHEPSNKLYFSHPDPKHGLFRANMKVWSSADAGKSWQEEAVVWDSAAGYSALVNMKDDNTLGLFYGRNNHTMTIFEAQEMSFATVEL
ncbi:hypothetical protein TrCOL_g2294 [Triparma columacea]|uniref:Sialidase domain-containing protein n=1 Tax=Triparma columacea TaxID=722753 RepID=A0A9W7G099_9STRA|nr:hypothetical protein TrCOL_g2294 [Triparma columacea]